MPSQHTHEVDYTSLHKSLAAPLLLGQCSSHGLGPLGTEVQGLVLPSSIQFPQIRPLVVIDDGQHTSNRLSNHLHFGQFRGRPTGDLVHAELRELCLELLELLHQVFLALPP